MNATAALAMGLLKGDVVTIKTAFSLYGITNAPREISRAIEQPFGIEVSRVKREGKSRWGVYCTWTEYRLNRSERNLAGIEKLKAHVAEQMGSGPAKTTQEQKNRKILDQIQLF